MSAPSQPRTQRERTAQWAHSLDALHGHCDRARSLAALLALCGEVAPAELDPAAIGFAGHWLVAELEALRACVRALEAAR